MKNSSQNSSNELNELRTIVFEQNRKINAMENLLNSCNKTLQTYENSQGNLVAHIQDLENELKNNSTANLSFSKDRSDITIQLKTLSGKVTTMESIIRNSDNNYATKESFAKLIDTVYDQMKNFESSKDISLQKSDVAYSSIQSIIEAITGLNFNGNGE
jgi:chromosome segregation ATPase